MYDNRSHFGSSICATKPHIRRNMSFNPKRSRTTQFGRVSHLSAAALSNVLREIRELGMPEHSSTATIMRERQRIVNQDTPFGTVLQTVSARAAHSERMIDVHIQHPYAFLWAACKMHATFRSFVRDALDRSGNRLSIIFYSDEINAGRATADVKTREIEGCYWSVKEFGLEALGNDDAWFCIVATRTQEIHKMRGGMAQIFSICFHIFHQLQDGVIFHEHGEDEPRVLHGRIEIVVQDERAHKAAFCLKGATGSKFCVCCMRYVEPKSAWLPDHTGFCIPGHSEPLDRTQLHTDASIKRVATRLEDVAVAARLDLVATTSAAGLATLERLEREFGFIYQPECVLFDHKLDVNLISMFVWDWLHVYFASCVFSNEIEELSRRLDRYAVGSKRFNDYTKLWKWPRAYASGSKVCQAGTGSTDYSPSGTASEYLSICPVLANYMQAVVLPMGICVDEAKSMIALCDVADLLLLAMHGKCTPDQLEAATNTYNAAHATAYDTSLWKPKKHYKEHMPDMLRKHGFLIACFVHERKHRMIKRFAIGRHNDKAFDRGVLEEVTLQHFHDLERPLTSSWLRDAHPAPPKLRAALAVDGHAFENDTVLTARVAMVRSRAVTMGDVVLFDVGGQLGVAEVYFHACINGNVHSCISPWTLMEDGTHVAKYRVVDNPRLVSTSILRDSCIHSVATAGSVSQVLVPPLYRRA